MAKRGRPRRKQPQQKMLAFEVPTAVHLAIKNEAAARQTSLAALMRSQISTLPMFRQPKKIKPKKMRS